MSVGSNPTPVRKRSENDEAEPSADKFCHTGTSIQDDCRAKESKKIATSSGVDNRAVSNCTEKYTQERHVKHECTHGFKCKSLQMHDTNRLADYISKLKRLPNGKAKNPKKKMCRRKQGRIAERSKEPGSRKSSVENSGTRGCAWVRIPLLSENVLNTMRQSLQPTNSVTLER